MGSSPTAPTIEDAIGNRVWCMKKYKVMIKGLGVKSVKAKDIDVAYINACKQHGCKIDDILVVMCEDPFKPGERL